VGVGGSKRITFFPQWTIRGIILRKARYIYFFSKKKRKKKKEKKKQARARGTERERKQSRGRKEGGRLDRHRLERERQRDGRLVGLAAAEVVV